MKKLILLLICLSATCIAFSQGYLGKTTANVNLREGAETDTEILILIPKGANIYIFDEPLQEGFYHVHFIDENISGYVYFKYVKWGDFLPASKYSPFSSKYNTSGSQPTLEITNDTELTLTLLLNEELYIFSPNETKEITILAGKYKYFASAKGVLPNSGEEVFKTSYLYTWTFYISTTRK